MIGDGTSTMPGQPSPFRNPLPFRPVMPPAPDWETSTVAASFAPQRMPALPFRNETHFSNEDITRNSTLATPLVPLVRASTTLPNRTHSELSASEAPHAPSAAVPAPGKMALTLSQYAGLCAEIAVFPKQAAEVFARYGLAEMKERLRIDFAWQERLRRNPEEARSWQELYQRYHAYWSDHARRLPR